MEEKLIKLLEHGSVEIIIRTHIPYMAIGTTEEYGVIEKLSVADGDVTGYGVNSENISQPVMTRLKRAMIESLKDIEQSIAIEDIENISWYEPSGKQGGEEGIEVDFKNRKILPSHRQEEKITSSNIDEAQWVIENNIKSIRNKINEIKEKLSLTKEKIIPIPNGHKVIQPPSEKTKEALNIKFSFLEKKKRELESIDLKDLIK